MSFAHFEAVRKLEIVGAPKVVLLLAAWHACEGCGLAFAGAELMALEGGLSESAVRRAMGILRDQGLILTIGYATGGRGRATEYLVAPEIVSRPRGICQRCGKNTSGQSANTLAPRQGLSGNTLAPRQGIARKPWRRGTQYPGVVRENPGVTPPQPSVEPEPSEQTGGPPASPSASAPPQDFVNPTRPPHDPVASRAAEEFMLHLTQGDELIANAEPSSNGTEAPDRDKAKESGQDTKPPETEVAEGS